MHPNGALLKYNTLWRAGMHYNYVFFKVSHTTDKGTIMGHYIESTRTCEYFDHDVSRNRWRIGDASAKSRLQRLKHPSLWEAVTETEIEEGVSATSCVY